MNPTVPPALSFEPRFSGPPTLRDVLRAGLLPFLLVAVCLTFQLPKAFTIDDTIFLRTAQQALKTPLRPFAFDMCWEADGDVRRFSQFVAQAPLMGYVLIPAVMSPSPEVTGHLIQVLLLGLGTLATASLALRWGLSVQGAGFAALLTTCSPAVIGMTATVMPDILAMTLSVIAVERFLAWRQGGGRWCALTAGAAMALAPLARPQVAIILPVCALLCLSEVSPGQLRARWRRTLAGLTPIVAAAAVYEAILLLTRDPQSGGRVLREGLINFSPHVLFHHGMSLGDYMCLTTPMVAGVLILLLRRRYWLMAAMACVAVPLLRELANGSEVTNVDHWYLYAAAGLAYLALALVLAELLKGRTGPTLALALWIVTPLAVIPYLHMAAKYAIPSAPAWGLILAICAGGFGRVRWYRGALPAVGLAMGMLIVNGDARAANMGRFAIEKWMPSIGTRGGKVFFDGQWGFQWYAEMRGAACFDPKTGSSARPGDFVAVDVLGGKPFPLSLYPGSRLVDVVSSGSAGGLVLSEPLNTGFFSDSSGRLPWVWAPAGMLRYELWEIR